MKFFNNLRESLIPQGLLKELRFLVRERLDLIESSSAYVNKMQRALELMNIKLANVISQIQGASGLKILRAILAGERDPERLASLCHKSILKTKAEDVAKSLHGNYTESLPSKRESCNSYRKSSHKILSTSEKSL